MAEETIITRWRALLVGVRDYEDPAFTPVRYAVEDVTALAGVLEGAGYEWVRVLHNERPVAERPTIQNVTAALDELVEGAGADTLLLVYFAGHGVTDDGEAYLLPHGSVGGNYAYAIGVRRLEERLLDSGARAAVLVLDACHAGALLGTRAADPGFVRRVIEQARGLAVLSACDGWELAHEDDDLGHGVFTHYLLEALGGAARDGRSPYLTASRAYEYVADGVADWAARNGKKQHPTWEGGVHGDPPLVRLAEPARVNPFVAGPAVRDPARFYGREAALRAVAGRVGGVSAQSISVVGERRIGKSSLLWQIRNRAGGLFHTGHRYVVLYLDLSGAAGRSNGALMRTLRRELEGADLPAWAEDADGNLASLGYALEELEAAAPDVRLVLLLDEFECVNDHPVEFDGLLGELRAEAQLGRLALVTASAAPLADLCAQGRIEVSPFFNVFTQVELGELEEDAWRALVSGGLGEVGDEDWRYTEECAGRHPFLTQLATGLLWEAREAGAVDYAALREAFEAQAAPHWAYWERTRKTAPQRRRGRGGS